MEPIIDVTLSIIHRHVDDTMNMTSVYIPESWMYHPITMSNYLPSVNMRSGVLVNNSDNLIRSIAIVSDVFTGIDLNWLWERRYDARYLEHIQNYFFYPLFHIETINMNDHNFSQLINTRRRIAEIRRNNVSI